MLSLTIAWDLSTIWLRQDATWLAVDLLQMQLLAAHPPKKPTEAILGVRFSDFISILHYIHRFWMQFIIYVLPFNFQHYVLSFANYIGFFSQAYWDTCHWCGYLCYFHWIHVACSTYYNRISGLPCMLYRTHILLMDKLVHSLLRKLFWYWSHQCMQQPFHQEIQFCPFLLQSSGQSVRQTALHIQRDNQVLSATEKVFQHSGSLEMTPHLEVSTWCWFTYN